MKKILTVTLSFMLSLNLISQTNMEMEIKEDKSITVGILQGGGSLIGADFEALLTDKIGLQFGLGIIGFGAGLNYHFKPSIRSSFISLQYWNQGYDELFSQNLAGVNYVFRSKKWFTAQIGLGFPISQGPAFPESLEQTPIMLMYSIGAYFPFN